MTLIGRFEHLPGRPRSDEARPLLEKIASQVKPIMQKRGWKVGTLAEFLPANPALLGNNMNAGQKINLRLRPPGDTNNFYEYDQLVLVMLHELTHNEHGPHSAQFYKLLAELEEEFYELKRKGYSGEGFHSAGNHLSGLKVDEYHGRAKGLAAAEKRLAVQRTIGKGGVLGGSSTRGRTMKEVLAEAAERRIRDDKACGTTDAGHTADVEAEVRKAAQASVGVDVIDLTGEDEDADRRPARTTLRPAAPAKAPPAQAKKQADTITKTATRTTSQPHVLPTRQKAAEINDRVGSQIPQPTVTSKAASSLSPPEWSCPTCTLLNPIGADRCEACSTPKSSNGRAAATTAGDLWWCDFCGAGPRELSFWSCLQCGSVRKWG